MVMTSRNPNTITATLLSAGLIIASIAGAQLKSDERPPLSRPQPKREVGDRPAFAGQGRFAAGFERLFSVLTEEQRASFREAMEAQRKTIRELEEKIRDARKEIFEAGFKEKFDEEMVRQKAMAAAKLDAELTVVRTKAFSQIRPALSAEQIEKIKNVPPPATGEVQPERPRRRPDIKRDENGLPPKDRVPSEPAPK